MMGWESKCFAFSGFSGAFRDFETTFICRQGFLYSTAEMSEFGNVKRIPKKLKHTHGVLGKNM